MRNLAIFILFFAATFTIKAQEFSDGGPKIVHVFIPTIYPTTSFAPN